LAHATRSRLLLELGSEESPESAHDLLLRLGHWTDAVNPHPRRLGLELTPPVIAIPPLPPDGSRLDLTALPAIAIDAAETDTPDDALSLDGGRLWVHVADAGALILPGSELEAEAMTRGGAIHLPEGVVPMIPPAAISALGLGFADASTALSFGIDLGPQGEIAGFEVRPTWVRVTRATYDEAEASLEEEPFRGLLQATMAYSARRRLEGAVNMQFPEVEPQVRDGQVSLVTVPPLRSRTIVEEAMIMAGEAAASFASAHGIPVPYATQESPGEFEPPQTLSAMYALRRTMKPRQYHLTPAPHAGLGLAAYTQVTSPLRRYLDLAVHMQLRAYLAGRPCLTEEEMLRRIGAVDAVLGAVRLAESRSARHWILVHLRRHPEWRGTGILVEKRGGSGTLIIPELGLDERIHLPADPPLDAEINLALSGVDLARLDVRFRVHR